MASVDLDVATPAGPPPARSVPAAPVAASSPNSAPKPNSSVRHEEGAYEAAAPHPMHDKIILGLTAATIALVFLWVIMYWAPSSDDEAYQSLIANLAPGLGSQLIFLGATIFGVIFSARSGNGGVSIAVALLAIIFTMFFFTFPFLTEFALTAKKGAFRESCKGTAASAVSLQRCKYSDGEAAGWVLTWLCQLGWTCYGVYIARANQANIKPLIGSYGKWSSAGIAIALLGYFLYWACSMAVYSNYESGSMLGYDQVLWGLSFWHTMGLAASLGSMVYWLFTARHMLEDVLIVNASVLFYYLSTLIWTVKRIATVGDPTDAPCGGTYTPIGSSTSVTVAKTDGCNPQAALASAYVILTAGLLINTIVLATVFFKFQRKGRLAEYVNAAPGADI